ncbi:hypothetical protein V8E52_008829 [Russula decolorans]|jgi:hypothetical protein
MREISFAGSGVLFEKFITATNYHFPALALESLVLHSYHSHEPNIPVTLLRGPDQSDLRLRRLTLYGAVSGLLLSATALTNLTLHVSSNVAVFGLSQLSSLLACLQGMQCLRSLDLATPFNRQHSQSQHSTPKDIVPLSKLTRFHYSSSSIFLNNFMSGLSAPSLRDVRLVFCGVALLYLSRVIDDVRQEFRSVSVTFDSNISASYHRSTRVVKVCHCEQTPSK